MFLVTGGCMAEIVVHEVGERLEASKLGLVSVHFSWKLRMSDIFVSFLQETLRQDKEWFANQEESKTDDLSSTRLSEESADAPADPLAAKMGGP